MRILNNSIAPNRAWNYFKVYCQQLYSSVLVSSDVVYIEYVAYCIKHCHCEI